jgi:hypothetical protein
MIQRYNFNSVTNDEFYEEDNNGEWVKWDDIKHLMPFQEKLEEYLDKDVKKIINGTSTQEAKGILKFPDNLDVLRGDLK